MLFLHLLGKLTDPDGHVLVHKLAPQELLGLRVQISALFGLSVSKRPCSHRAPDNSLLSLL